MTRRVLPVLRAKTEVLPALQAAWVAAWDASGVLPAEVDATCDDCAMVVPGGAAAGTLSFLPETRCCTYLPMLANFLVGGVLSREAATGHGARSVRARIASGEGVSPWGVIGAPAETACTTVVERFGRDGARRCPHLEVATGRCGIWQHRESTCATWFCKHTRGARSKAYWNRLHQLLQALEGAVALHCAHSLGIPAAGLARLLPLATRPGTTRADLDDGPLDASALWGPWAHDLEGYFRACYDRAAALSPDEVLSLGGASASAMTALVHACRSRLDETGLPARLTLGQVSVVALGPETLRVQSYSAFDPLDVPRALWEVLYCFNGRATDEAVAQASAAAGQPVPAGAVAMLVDAGILRAV